MNILAFLVCIVCIVVFLNNLIEFIGFGRNRRAEYRVANLQGLVTPLAVFVFVIGVVYWV